VRVLVAEYIFYPSYVLQLKVFAHNLHHGCWVMGEELVRIPEFTSCVPAPHMNAFVFDTGYSERSSGTTAT
jgi:hypothetical protein